MCFVKSVIASLSLMSTRESEWELEWPTLAVQQRKQILMGVCVWGVCVELVYVMVRVGGITSSERKKKSVVATYE